MRLLEDFVTEDEIAAIESVISSDTPRFDLLAKTAGLDPRTDFTFADLRKLNFCGADLRGFNFTGSDLRQCIRNENTLIDETTILHDTALDWIEIEALPIVIKMQEVEAASTSAKRQQVLNQLTTEFGKTTHVITYMVSAAARAKSLDDFLDFMHFLPEEISEGQSESLRAAALKLFKKKLASNRSRTRRDKTTIFAIESIADKLQQSSNSLAERIFDNLAEIVNSDQTTVALRGMVVIEPKDMEEAFRRIGR